MEDTSIDLQGTPFKVRYDHSLSPDGMQGPESDRCVLQRRTAPDHEESEWTKKQIKKGMARVYGDIGAMAARMKTPDIIIILGALWRTSR